MYLLAGAVALVAAVLLLDRIGLWAERRGWVYWRRNRPPVHGSGAAGLFGEMQALFSPSHRHVIDEGRSRQMSRSDTATGKTERMTLDLRAGIVAIDVRRNSHE
ncbi:DUF6191 domain-containing protein [Rhodococcus aetherivorans]|uniref:DUF6191 domain-containing protein n=1 Tax=Rhodococcus aetherivorans TaxID=191292 RepID=UPI001E3FF488|nr:DUF6191 domain-containing protein [Rhodococcus aetherivorans]UGQ39399.1 DUF6191 domain-containing protein [Rhodococcus aetherivorans]